MGNGLRVGLSAARLAAILAVCRANLPTGTLLGDSSAGVGVSTDRVGVTPTA